MSKDSTLPNVSDETIAKDPKVQRYLKILSRIIEDGGSAVKLRFSKPIMFGKRIGFIMANAEVRDAEGDMIPAGAFLRGDSVAVLVILRSEKNSLYAVVTEQYRLPIGKKMLEIPAGTFEDSGSMAGLAASELEEELGLKIEMDQMNPLGPEDGVAVSPGGSDERIYLFLLELDMPEAKIQEMQGRLAGNRDHGEKITVQIVREEQVLEKIQHDAKSLAAWCFYLSSTDMLR